MIALQRVSRKELREETHVEGVARWKGGLYRSTEGPYRLLGGVHLWSWSALGCLR